MFNPEEIQKQFPILKREVNGHPLIYLDSAATSQKPQAVIDAVVDYYSNHNANIHRGVHTLSDESTNLYQEARQTVANFLGAQTEELIFTANTTEAINLVALAWARHQLTSDSVILTSELEHHSNLVVWQEICKQTGARLEFVKITEDGQIRLDHLINQVHRFKKDLFLVTLTHISNVTGAVLNIKKAIEEIKSNAKAKVLLDIAQSVAHTPIDFGQLEADFLAFSGHKLYGPMGIGGLVIKKDLIEDLKPLYYGGGMIDEVFYKSATFAKNLDRFDAGTPNVVGAVGLATAVQFLEELGMEDVENHSRELTAHALNLLKDLTNLKIVGPMSIENRLGSVAFIYNKGHAHDVAQILDSQGLAVRSGHHCTMPLHEKMGWGSTVRASFGIYNTKKEIDSLVEGLHKVEEIIS